NDSMSDYDKAKKIYDYIINIGSPSVKKNGETIRFTENNRTAYSAATLLIEGKGVCEAYAVAFSRLAERSGLETKWVSSIYTPLLARPEYRQRFQVNIDSYKTRSKVNGLNHAWNQVKIDGKWYNLDVYHGDYYDEHKSDRYYFFLKSDETFENGIAPRIWVKDLTYRANEDYKLLGKNNDHIIFNNIKSPNKQVKYIDVTAETSKPETSKPETIKPETIKPEISKLETSKPETSKPETIKPEISKPEISKPETIKPEISKLETSKPETSKPETIKPEISKLETSKPETIKPEISKPEISKLETSKPETSKLKYNFKNLPKTGDISDFSYLGGILISLVALLNLNRKKFN
ncbi:transglutaminase domain-containing protein, partial [Clostridium perfringens]|uniref:transglutaminase domain-containing protein n=1 Tax=Clostridium perfringens TaxID=1502 RepID=UPI001ABB1504